MRPSIAGRQPALIAAPTVFALALATLVLHGRVLLWPFISDDYLFLYRTRDWPGLCRSLQEATNYFRPIGRQAYFFFGQKLAGSEPLAFHVANLMLHVATIGLVLTIAWRVAGPRAALFSASIYAFAYPHAVLLGWVSCAQDLLATAFGVTAAILHMRGQRWWAAGAFLAGMLSKESIAALPIVLAIWEGARPQGTLGLGRRATTVWRATWPFWLAGIGWIALVLLARSMRAVSSGSGYAADVSLAPGSLWEGLRSALLSYIYMDQPLRDLGRSLAVHRIPWAAFAVIGVIASMAHMLRRHPERPPASHKHALLLGAVWATVGAIPVALAGHHFSAYYASFATVGFAMVGGLALQELPSGWPAVVLALAAVLNVAANNVSNFRVTMAAQSEAGLSYVTLSRLGFEAAFAESLRTTLARDPPPRGGIIYLAGIPRLATVATGGETAPKVWFHDPSLSMASITAYRPDASARPSRFLSYDPSSHAFQTISQSAMDAVILGETALAEGRPALARTHLEEALRQAVASRNRAYQLSLGNALGVAVSQLGDTAAARKAWADVLAVDPANRDALLNLASHEAQAGHWDAARSLVGKTLEDHPRDVTALTLAFRLERAVGDQAGADAAWRRLAQVSPSAADSLR